MDLSILLSMGIWEVASLGYHAESVCEQGFCGYKHWFHLDINPEENLLGQRVYLSLALIDAAKQISEVVLSYGPNSNRWEF